ncbi:patatin-like phospholipase family protein [Siculibacillus lacustris]|uniref:Patatin-like phospholipase family protein n=1 Tax=Siculibacillus lacustris TaxID=1549641 RepID=A0A4Q9VIY8_9HYPH|nr:patatin-like phospholipase family protein [Siculibacillus lacustris]TBW34990.1 patatin-like phospholipase family protein [Siculibacillus lacustris]
MTEPRIGVVLGGGGARGIAHIPVLEALDDLGLVPTAIAGTSIGAIIGAARAGGLSAAEIRERTLESFGNRSAALAKLWTLRPRRLGDLLTGGIGLGQLSPEKILTAYVGDALRPTFEDLPIPLAVVATDYYGGCEVVLTTGELRRAVAASIAIPTLFKPVVIDGRVLMDGGIMNPVPVDVLTREVDVVLAVDVVSFPELQDGHTVPGALEAMFGASQLLMQQIAAAKFDKRRPDILLRPAVGHIRVLDFLEAKAILAAGEGLREETKRRLGRLLEAVHTEPLPAIEPPKKRGLLARRRRG